MTHSYHDDRCIWTSCSRYVTVLLYDVPTERKKTNNAAHSSFLPTLKRLISTMLKSNENGKNACMAYHSVLIQP